MPPSPFQSFRAAIDAATADIGPSEHLRVAVATAFHDALKHAIVARLGLRASYDLPFDLGWTLAEDADLAEAVRQAHATALRARSGEPATRRAGWKGSHLVQRGGIVCLEGAERALLVAMAGSPDRGFRGSDESRSVFLTDTGKLALWGRTLAPHPAKPTSVTVRSAAAADKALVRLVSGFFGVELEGIPDPDGIAAAAPPAFTRD